MSKPTGLMPDDLEHSPDCEQYDDPEGYCDCGAQQRREEVVSDILDGDLGVDWPDEEEWTPW